jgi:hypothetical protein
LRRAATRGIALAAMGAALLAAGACDRRSPSTSTSPEASGPHSPSVDDGPPTSQPAPPASPSPSAGPESPPAAPPALRPRAPAPPPAIIGDMDERRAVALVLGEIERIAKARPTLAVWLMDRSASAAGMREQVRYCLPEAYRRWSGRHARLEGAAQGPATQPPLLTAVMAFGASADVVTPRPTDDPAVIESAFERIGKDPSGREATFAAIERAISVFSNRCREEGRTLVLVLVTDETGDDAQRADDVALRLIALRATAFVVGVPAPLGRVRARSRLAEVDSPLGDWSAWEPVRQGPESRHLERIHLAFWDGSDRTERLDSGFGPFPLEYLCRRTGGRFVAVRSSLSQKRAAGDLPGGWPSGSPFRVDPEMMKRYAPDYVSEAGYQELLSQNKARLALHQAAGLAPVGALAYPALRFKASTAAKLKQLLDEAQKKAAKLEPEVMRLHDILVAGEADRPTLIGPRWQAGYDLALGRVLAARARIEGFNAMLAGMKSGRKFRRPGSTTWVLVPADTIETGTALEKIAARAEMYLRRVVHEHAGTPWAYIAQRELAAPLGWRWTEE